MLFWTYKQTFLFFLLFRTTKKSFCHVLTIYCIKIKLCVIAQKAWNFFFWLWEKNQVCNKELNFFLFVEQSLNKLTSFLESNKIQRTSSKTNKSQKSSNQSNFIVPILKKSEEKQNASQHKFPQHRKKISGNSHSLLIYREN